jgi:hypothetical protein
MTDLVKAEYEAYWECPKCENRVYECDVESYEAGEIVNVMCSELVDDGGLDLVPCGHVYQVDAR